LLSAPTLMGSWKLVFGNRRTEGAWRNDITAQFSLQSTDRKAHRQAVIFKVKGVSFCLFCPFATPISVRSGEESRNFGRGVDGVSTNYNPNAAIMMVGTWQWVTRE
jgi:hypothetical protein